MLNQRKQERIEIENKLYLNKIQTGIIKDISLGGLKFSFKKEIKISNSFIIKILSKKYIDCDIILNGIIKWQKKENENYIYGLEFINLSDDNIKKMIKFLDYLKFLGRNHSKIDFEIILPNNS